MWCRAADLRGQFVLAEPLVDELARRRSGDIFASNRGPCGLTAVCPHHRSGRGCDSRRTVFRETSPVRQAAADREFRLVHPLTSVDGARPLTGDKCAGDRRVEEKGQRIVRAASPTRRGRSPSIGIAIGIEPCEDLVEPSDEALGRDAFPSTRADPGYLGRSLKAHAKALWWRFQ